MSAERALEATTDDRPTIRSLSGKTTYVRGPEPTVVFASLLQLPDHPGVTFVFPYHPETTGGAQSDIGYAIPLVIVTADLTVEQVMAAALEVGERYRIKQQMRRAVQRWAKSDDWRQNPHRCPSEWATEQ